MIFAIVVNFLYYMDLGFLKRRHDSKTKKNIYVYNTQQKECKTRKKCVCFKKKKFYMLLNVEKNVNRSLSSSIIIFFLNVANKIISTLCNVFHCRKSIYMLNILKVRFSALLIGFE